MLFRSYWDLHKDVVFGLGFNHDVQLVNLQRNLVTNAVDIRQFEVETCVRDLVELTEALNDGSLSGTNNEVAIKNGHHNEK